MRKPLRFLKNQLINAILMVALTVPLLVVAVSLDQKPTLSFEGARIELHRDADGELSAQLLFDVCVSNVDYTDGVQFQLYFNPNYLEPSDYETNEPLCVLLNGSAGTVETDKEFKANPGLYYADVDGKIESVDPFATPPAKQENKVSKGGLPALNFLTMYLMIDRALVVDPKLNPLMVSLSAGDQLKDKINMLMADKKLVLGTLSFRVVDLDLLPTITKKFGGLTDVVYDYNHAKDDDNDKLIYFIRRATTEAVATPWGIGYLKGTERDREHAYYNDIKEDRDARATFTYDLPRTIIKARAAEAELTINAYQAYTIGSVADIDEALQRYSPAITVTYSDGSEGNFIMPWSRMEDTVDGLDWKETRVYDWAEENWRDNNGILKSDWKAPLSTRKLVVDHPDPVDNADQIRYDPTASGYKPDNQRYLVQKDFCYEERGENKVFPLPIDVRLTVTPITLIDVTANDLTRSYVLSDTLVDGVTAVQSLSALKLPSQARLITDVPAGGVTLTMDIPGWSHPQDYTVDGGMETRYWPSANTDPNDSSIVLPGTGETVRDLWNDRAANETEGDYLHWPTISDKGKWTETETANGAYLGTNRAGVYTFKMADGFGGVPKYFTRPEIQALYPWLTVPNNNKVSGHPEAWPIDDATRTIVWNDDPDKPDEPELVDTNAYVVEYRSTLDGSNDQPELTLRVHKAEVGKPDQYIDLPNASIFRIKLPDGTEMAVGYTEPVHEVDQGGDWFANNDGHYQEKAVSGLGGTGDKRGFDLISNPGDPTKSTDPSQPGYGDEREKLRRYINLGGWFYVSVKEREQAVENGPITDKTTWSDFMPVYVPPRDNYYTESKEYNFIGDNAELYPWAGGLSTTVILPPGTYNPVEINAGQINPAYKTEGGVTSRVVERYDLTTTYDGATGAQPGRLNTFTIDPASGNDWGRTGPTSAVNTTDGTPRNVTTYGPEVFKDSVLYNAYGKVLNKLTDRGMVSSTYAPDAERATVRLEETEGAHPVEKIILEYVETHGGERSVDYDDTNGYDSEYRERYNVSNVIFETKTQGYTARQDYVLRIKNVGDVDIHGLSIDTLTDLVGNPIYDKDLDSDPAGGHFEILKPPASFLPVGESTTFVLTYVYDLKAQQSAPMNYRDKLFITSNSKHRVGVGAYNDYHDPLTSDANKPYLLDFDAQFQVTNSDIYRVFVRYIPTDGCMGTAGVIIGLENDDISKPMNTSAGPTAYAEGDTVYILISPTDEYTMVNVWAANTAIPTQRVSIGPYDNDSNPGSSGHLPGGDIRMVYAFTMPAHDTTVTVVFNEPTRSKLRISDLRVYRDLDHSVPEEPNCLYPWNGKNDLSDNAADWDAIVDSSTGRKYKDDYEELPIWRKSFTDDELTEAKRHTQGDNEKLYLMTQGAADQPGSRPNFVDTVEQYLVVLPFDADIAQVEIDLRKVLYLFDKDNGDPIDNKALTNIVVQMTLFDSEDLLSQTPFQENIFSGTGTDIYPENWNSAPYVGHYPGETNGPTTHTSIPFLSPEPGTSKYVRVELSYTEGTETESRSYYLEIHRAKKEVEAELNYGNSPYGMIMNATNIVGTVNKDRAKAAFVNNNYTFVKSDNLAALTPEAVTDGELTGIHYWLEAWAEPTEKWKAPNADWSTTNNYDPDPTATPDPNGVYDADTGMGWELYHQVTTDSNVNLDLNDYAFFAIMGEKFKDPGLAWAKDSSGRPVDLTKAVLSLTVYTLDNSTGVDKDTPDDQLTRFALPGASATGVPSGDDTADVKARTVTIDFVADGSTPAVSAVSGNTVTADWATWYITDDKLTQTAGENSTLVELRPGRYRLAYTFPDYNYVAGEPDYENNFLTVYRDFVVLAPVGDVNADLALTTKGDKTTYATTEDEVLVEGRISPNAGYPALGYMANYYNYSAIFKLRTCDVNNDRNINNIDANTILRNTGVARFYLPVDYK